MALRVMAGFEKTDSYFLPRGRAKPSDELCALIWPWLGGCLQLVQESAGCHPTAVHFLQFLDLLRSIILQDAAVMFLSLRNEEACEQRRLKHTVFSLPVFHSSLFAEFVDEMATVLENEVSNDPNDAAVERALPGVGRRFDEVVRMLREMHGKFLAFVCFNCFFLLY
jgi:hypothetical protein